jgi:hypothetical protein
MKRSGLEADDGGVNLASFVGSERGTYSVSDELLTLRNQCC